MGSTEGKPTSQRATEARVDEPRRGLDRRTVMKAGAHAAWAVPVVQLVTTVPAMAASGPAAISFEAASATRTDKKITVTVTFKNANTQPSENLRLHIRIEGASGNDFQKEHTFPRGWVRVDSGRPKTEMTLTTNEQVPANGTLGPRTLVLEVSKKQPATLSLSALVAGGGTGGSTQVTTR